MNNKQSSIEKLAELIRFTNKEVYAELFDEIEQIKAMHEQEIVNAFVSGEHQQGFEGEAEQYYNETFGGNK